jgi:hypothetical protein
LTWLTSCACGTFHFLHSAAAPVLRMHAAHTTQPPLSKALRMPQLCNPSCVGCAGDPVTTLGALLRRLLDISARPASLAALFPPPPGWQEPPPYPLLLAAKPPEKAAGVEGPRPKSARGAGPCMGSVGVALHYSTALHSTATTITAYLCRTRSSCVRG